MANRHLSVATVIEKNKLASAVAFVVALEIDVKDQVTGAFVETLRFVRNDEDITYKSAVYTAASFDFEVQNESNTLPRVQVIFRDYTRDVQSRMEAYGGGVGFDVRILVLNSGNLSAGPEMRETFTVTTAAVASFVVTFGLGAENPLTALFPRRRQFRDRCPWRFKSAQCGYTGAVTSCDFSLQGINGCAAKGNQANFGGFPGLSRP